ncbi:hypothetical protein, partial [Leucobacter sp. M11]|uniref:hypothetical protein n=1 Tax=Leucobacter sp. M11 TaxID=2993565 RepID=UPI002D811139
PPVASPQLPSADQPAPVTLPLDDDALRVATGVGIDAWVARLTSTRPVTPEKVRARILAAAIPSRFAPALLEATLEADREDRAQRREDHRARRARALAGTGFLSRYGGLLLGGLAAGVIAGGLVSLAVFGNLPPDAAGPQSVPLGHRILMFTLGAALGAVCAAFVLLGGAIATLLHERGQGFRPLFPAMLVAGLGGGTAAALVMLAFWASTGLLRSAEPRWVWLWTGGAGVACFFIGVAAMGLYRAILGLLPGPSEARERES